MKPRYLFLCFTVAWFNIALCGAAENVLAVEPLGSYNVDLTQTSVSGISSGAFMAVQFGVAHSSIITGVGATSGGPFFCAGEDASANFSLFTKVIPRCMQGDPQWPKQDIDTTQMIRMINTTNTWASSGKIDPISNLAKQHIWIFHGYNDGIVKEAVTDALYRYYTHYINPQQIFYKNNLHAGHAHITASCDASTDACNACAETGGKFINHQCQDSPPTDSLYDATGSLLQHIYGTLQAKQADALTGHIKEFSQEEFVRDNRGNTIPVNISMANSGYVFVPTACEAGEPCKIHIAFHGCKQSASWIGDAFYQHAGYNEWADTNRIIVLYPQTVSTPPVGPLPSNPDSCWDWWGYNDFFDSHGRYATKAGLQIATVRRMLDRLAGLHNVDPSPDSSGDTFGIPDNLVAGDLTHEQVLLRWKAVPQAVGYKVYRKLQVDSEYQALNENLVTTTRFVDNALIPKTAYTYVVTAFDRTGQESERSEALQVITAKTPPACDPYYSLDKHTIVTRTGLPTQHTCP